jgi:hypothetical protein
MSIMESKSKEAVLTLLRELVRQIQSMDDEQISEVMAGTGKLEVRVVRSKRVSISKRSGRTDHELRQLGESLRAAQTREEGNLLLDERITSKDDLARLARQLDAPVQKTDSAEQIRARIIESTIGFRIRSAAVQGPSNKPYEPAA